MKKLLLILMLGFLTSVYADKDITLTDIDMVGARTFYNYTELVGEEDVYYAAAIQHYGVATTGNGGTYRANRIIKLGVSKSTPYTLQQIYTILSNFNAGYANEFKQIVLQLINTDVSQ